MEIEEIAKAPESLDQFFDQYLGSGSKVLQRMIGRELFSSLQDHISSQIPETGFADCVRMAWQKFGSGDTSVVRA